MFRDHAGLSTGTRRPELKPTPERVEAHFSRFDGAGAQRACRRDHPAAALATARSVNPIKAPMTDWTGMEKPNP